MNERYKSSNLAALCLVAAAVMMHAACGKEQKPARPRPQPKESPEKKAREGRPEEDPVDKAPREARPAEDDLAKLREVKPSLPAYEVKPDLSNVANKKDFAKLLSPKLEKLIAKNGFGAERTGYVQPFFIYENNEYQRPNPLPAFITTDTMLHMFHIFFDYALRKVEQRKLYDVLVDLSETMVKASQKQLNEARLRNVRKAARRNMAFFAVARSLLGKFNVPRLVKKDVEAELKRITAHKQRQPSPVMGFKLDYTQFVPRGHYTKSAKLKRYFKVMMWYGLMPFPLPKPGQKAATGRLATLQALLIVRALRTAKHKGKPALDLWEKIYEPTAFFVGVADDYTPRDYAKIVERVYGRDPTLDGMADRANLRRFVAAAKTLPPPKVAQFVIGDGISGSRQFRFMGQRFIPDSRILQELTHPKVEKRFFPSGLDIFAALGSDRALSHLKKYHKADRHRGYVKQMSKMRAEMAKVGERTWKSNLYWGWLWALGSLVEDVPEGYPSFMRAEAWKDKSLLTGLGSWTELRHDTILYAKQSGAECGGDEGPTYRPKGYVEPNLLFWTRLKWLASKAKDGMDSRHLLDRTLKDRFRWLIEWVEFCRRATIKQLAGKRLKDSEYEKMRYFGAEMEGLFIQFAGGRVMTEMEKDMAVVADVHTSSGKVLEEGTGRVAAIYVAVPVAGKLTLTRGAIFTQYEFIHPASDRLTDEKWKKMLKEGKQPSLPKWVTSFMSFKKERAPKGTSGFLGGC